MTEANADYRMHYQCHKCGHDLVDHTIIHQGPAPAGAVMGVFDIASTGLWCPSANDGSVAP